MIIVRFTSGLGNQMFQYTFYKYLKRKYRGVEVKGDLSWFYAYNDHHGYELERIFKENPDSEFELSEASPGDIFKVTGLIPNIVKPRDMLSSGRRGRHKALTAKAFEKFRRYPNRILREFTAKKRLTNTIDQLTGNISNFDIVNEDGSIYNELYEYVNSLKREKDHYFIGFWIEERYFKAVLEEVRRAFVFPLLKGENRYLAERIEGENSVSIHVRRGDYLKEYKDSFKTLSRDYYVKAVDEIVKRSGITSDKLSFYIFSDDPEFVKKEFSWLDNSTVVTGNSGENSYRDMQLMSLCKHNIIANSTFSQWGSLLNKNEDHLTLYPKAYLKDRDNEEKTLKGWIMI
ncbi:MAG: alpha-1,2-fucosyltransferase [Lachnospiraceae bacterium]|nr:alpha-1,2-fucosyltransferase [Lachnospiraceae bacterium]